MKHNSTSQAVLYAVELELILWKYKPNRPRWIESRHAHFQAAVFILYAHLHRILLLCPQNLCWVVKFSLLFEKCVSHKKRHSLFKNESHYFLVIYVSLVYNKNDHKYFWTIGIVFFVNKTYWEHDNWRIYFNEATQK